MKRSSMPYRAAKAIYGFIKNELVFGLLLLPYGRARQRALLRNADRSNSHTYTSFYRSPVQLDALIGPVLAHFEKRGIFQPSILLFAGSIGAEAYTLASELRYRRPDLQLHIRASDLHAHTVERARTATYTMEEIRQNLDVPATFLQRTFDALGEDRYVVKPEIRAAVSFEQADLLSPELTNQFAPADIVFAQNVLFHMPQAMARQAFAAIVRMLKPGGVLFIDGMELDMRVDLARTHGLVPLDYQIKEIYQYSRKHIPICWWRYYYGNEPYVSFARHRQTRYGTIFLAPNAKPATS